MTAPVQVETTLETEQLKLELLKKYVDVFEDSMHEPVKGYKVHVDFDSIATPIVKKA